MNGLSWFLYFADVIGNVRATFTIIGIPLMLASIPLFISGHFVKWSFEKDHLQQIANIKIISRIGIIVAFVMVMIATLIPSQRTMYMIAASELGESVVTSDDGKEIYNELKSVIMSNLESLKPQPKESK